MNAAIYARKSTEQKGVCDEMKSVSRQVENGRAFAPAREWVVADHHVFFDDGISGAEFSGRPGLMRMMAAAARREFSVLIISESSRLGREQIETAFFLKQLDKCGVKVVSYRDGRELAITTPMDKVVRSISAFADEQEREHARERTHDAMMKKAMQKHVTGGRVFGYDNVPVYASGERHGTGDPIYKVREINEGEAAVVRRIFEMIGEGYGLRAVAKRLNDGVPRPRPQSDRPSGWAASSILPMLDRELYRGRIVYNTTRKRDDWGQRKQQPRPEAEWLRVPAPELRIVTDEQWQLAQEQRAVKRKTFGRTGNGQLQGRQPGAESKYLLAGLARCSVCNGTIHVRSRSHGRKRAYHYRCSAYHERGTKVCANGAIVLVADTNAAVINELETSVMTGAVVARTAVLIRERLKSSAPTEASSREALTAEAESIEDRIKNLVKFIASGVESKAISSELRELESKLLAIETQIAACDARVDVRLDADLDSKIAAKIRDWRAVLAGNVAPTRVLLKKLLVGPIVMTPLPGKTGYRFDGKMRLDELLAVGGAVSVASPRERSEMYKRLRGRFPLAALARI